MGTLSFTARVSHGLEARLDVLPAVMRRVVGFTATKVRVPIASTCNGPSGVGRFIAETLNSRAVRTAGCSVAALARSFMSPALRRSGLFGIAVLVVQCGGSSTPAVPDVPVVPAPSVLILSPASNQVLPAGQALEVRFSVTGTDSTGSTPVAFQLGEGSSRVAGVGRVVAFVDANGPVAEATARPDDANPFRVPDGTLGNATALLTPGSHRIRLELRYNDGSTVSPQRQGEVSIVVQ